ncbi:pyridoxal phosphate-dependent aminotransferase [Candidatus Omnitrophota bacterium]
MKIMTQIKPYLKNLYRTRQGENSRRNYLRLDMNESVSGLPEQFVKKTLNAIDPEFLAAYPEYEEFQKILAAHNNIDSANICLSNGSDAAIKYIYDAYISPGDKVLLTDPTFAMYPVYCKMFNAQVVNVTYKQDLSFSTEDFLDKISRDIKLAVVVNPNNPTGTAVEHDDLIAVIEKAANSNVLIIIDEAYFYFYPKSVMEKVKLYKNLIVLRTFSKLCGMASLRLGYAAACPEIIENLRKVKPTYDVNSLAILFADRILKNTQIIQSLIQEVNDGKKYLANKLREFKIGYKEGYANFVLIKCCNRVDEIVKRLAGKNILVQGGFKQEFLKDYIRVTVGNVTIMERFWESFIVIWKKQMKT